MIRWAGTPAAARPGARAPLTGRHAAVLGWAWRHRRQAEAAPRTADEQAFLPAALSLQETPVHPAPRRTAWLLMALFALALAWACIGKVDIVAVAPGRIIVGERSKIVQPLERSIVKQVLVRDGDRVTAGQALVELDPTRAMADTAVIQAQVISAAAEALRARLLQETLDDIRLLAPVWPALSATRVLSRSGAAIAADIGVAMRDLRQFPFPLAERQAAMAQMEAEWRDIAARLNRFAAESRRRQAEVSTVAESVAKLQVTLPLARQREDDFKALAAQGFVASHAGQDRTRERIELERDLDTQRARLLETMAGSDESDSARAAYLAETRRALAQREAQARLQYQLATQERAKAVQRERQTVLTAPVSGVVQQLAVHTIGGVVTEAQSLMVIVPDDAPGAPVVAEVALDNKDIGYVRAGQAAEVKLETFLFTRYGTVPATVQRVTADAVTDETRGAIFPARLLLASNAIDVDGRQMRIGPGMNITAEIKTGQRRLIEFLLSPVQRAGSESLRER